MPARKFLPLIIGALLIILAFTSPGDALAPINQAKTTVFRNIKVFDGTKWLSPCTVVVEGDTITAVGSDVTIPKGAEVIGGDGLALLPGLIDSHAHVSSLQDLRLCALFGVTSVMDMMAPADFMRQVKNRLKSAEGADMADFRTAGNVAVVPGGHGTEWGSTIPTLTKPEEAAAFVAARLAEGSDYLKIMSGMSKRVLPFETIEALAREARRRGMLTLVHTETQPTALAAIKAGVNGLAHAFADTPPEDDFIDTMKANRAFVIPTLTVMHRLKDARKIDPVADKRLADYLVPEAIDSLTKAKYPPDSDTLFYSVAEETVRRLNRAGVPVLVGTDFGNPGTVPGASLHTEMERLTYAGLTPTETLAAATSRPAEIFGLKDRGRIAAGMRADLLLVSGDPASAITDTRAIAGVWVRGARIDRPAYLAEMERQKKEWRDSGEIPPPMGSGPGLICDFDSGDYATRFGLYLFDMSDKMMGGGSSVAVTLAGEGAEGTAGSLAIDGSLDPKSPMPWAGVAYYPGYLVESLANLSHWDGVSFRVKGDRSEVTLMAMSDYEKMPAIKSFPVTKEWQKITVPFKDLGSDGKNIMAFIIGAANAPGPFHLQIDDLRLVKLQK